MMIFTLNDSSKLQPINAAPLVRVTTLLNRKPEVRPPAKPVSKPLKQSTQNPKWMLVIGMGD